MTVESSQQLFLSITVEKPNQDLVSKLVTMSKFIICLTKLFAFPPEFVYVQNIHEKSSWSTGLRRGSVDYSSIRGQKPQGEYRVCTGTLR